MKDERRWVGTWWVPLLVAGFTIVWVLIAYLLIGDRQRRWDYGVYPYVPASSIESTQKIRPTKAPPRQVEYPTNETGSANETP